eukprot:TRINITY_DN79056_c0_g1_i1.p1 TRINITY_DN79056_c0_g1~~TRINITY_DN79056_c0_g1_i1.p1  ORF type:complete len:303 (+),score=62.43 TRINITY_DN79056_c0_g1_i1:36-944(+)
MAHVSAAGSWAESTRIRFKQDNPKRSGSAAHERYEKYKVATTVAEAVELGAWTGDLSHDQKQGYLWKTKRQACVSAHEPLRKKPACASAHEPLRKKPAAKTAREHSAPKSKVVTAASGDEKKGKGKESKELREQIQNRESGKPSALGERKDIPLPSGLAGCEALWADMQKAGWRYCEFKYLTGIRKGMPYCRFVKPSGGSINQGIDEAIALYAKQNNLDLEKLLKSSGRQDMIEQEWNKRKLTPVERKKSVTAYRKKHGRLLAVPEGWALTNHVMASPEGFRCSLFTDVEAYFGARLLGLRK